MRLVYPLLMVGCWARVPTYVNEECRQYDPEKADKVEEHVIACIDVGPKSRDWTDTCFHSANQLYCKHELVVFYNDRTSVPCRLTHMGSAGREMCVSSGWKEK